MRFIVLLIGIAACGESPTPSGGCRADTDCGAGRVCHDTECVPPAKLRCTEGGSKVAHVSARPVTLDLMEVAGTSVSTTVELENTGDCTLQLRSVAMETADRFACISCPDVTYPLDVLPGRSHVIEVAVTPGAPGALMDTLVVETSDPDALTLRIPVSALSVGPPVLAVTPLEIDFGYVPVGRNKIGVVQAINAAPGSATLSIDSAELVGSDAFSMDPFAPTDLASALVDPNARLPIEVTYAPSADAVHTATLTFTPAVGAPISVLLHGRRDPPNVSVNPPSIDFGALLLGAQASARITIQNTGLSPLEGTRRLQVGHPDLSVPRSLPDLRPGGLFELDVLYQPTLAGPVGDSVVIETNDPDTPSISVTIQGAGMASGADVIALELIFDNDSDSLLDADLRDVDMILESPAGQVCGEIAPQPSFGTYGNPRWSSSGAKENPERIILPDAMEDGRFPVLLSYIEDCATLPTALTAVLLGIGTDELVDYFSDGEVMIDENELASAIETTCADRRSAGAHVVVTVNGLMVDDVPIALSNKGDSVTGLTLVRTNGNFTVER